jgi:NitT/TauT family transport system substrate-binding protein
MFVVFTFTQALTSRKKKMKSLSVSLKDCLILAVAVCVGCSSGERNSTGPQPGDAAAPRVEGDRQESQTADPQPAAGPEAGTQLVTLPARPTGEKKDSFTLAVSIYAGWMPHYYAKENGIYKKWADKYGLSIDVKYMDYVPSIEAYVAGQADACVMTNMEALDMPAAGGIDTTSIITGDYSNGNDAILVRDGLTLQQLAGQEISLVELTVSHYLLAAALDSVGLKESEVKLVNTSDSDIAPAFISNKSQKAVVTWNPMVMNIEQQPGVKRIYDSSSIPGEVLDLLVVNTATLEANPDFARALVGAWYEVMGIMSTPGPAADAALEQMAQLAGCSLAEYKAQLRTTAMYWTPETAVEYTQGSLFQERMNKVRQFCFQHGLLGESAKSVDAVGIEYPDGRSHGDPNNVKLRFDNRFMEEAQKGLISLN